MNDKSLATITLIGAGIIAIADAPDWKIDQFAGWIGGMVGVAILSQLNRDVGTAMAGLLLTAVVLVRGADAAEKTSLFIGGNKLQERGIGRTRKAR